MEKEQKLFDLFLTSYNQQITELANNREYLNAGDITKALELILNCKGKLVVTGMGKSGLIGQKMAATFSSTGTPAFFLHPGESLHGDLGCLQSNDIMLVIAKSGESEEVTSMLRVVQKMQIPIIAILGNADSTAGSLADVIINARVAQEADPLNLAPTASTTVALVIGDALAAALIGMRGFNSEHFALFHPAGQLGKRLLLKVDDLLQLDQGIPMLSVQASIPELLAAENGPNLGGVMIVDERGQLIGIVTDGDLR
ncbi:MAG: KpsF/GutQ family sugar-phosphate isomerase, partial [Leptospiraceae bacterium]|nr:KpsF/GutQ family sugar-phosphate isomerase [Leptospiraceae bacterium]